MTDDEFKEWFIKNLDTMVSMNIYHYNADKAKEIRAILDIVKPEFDELKSRITVLEKVINKKGTTRKASEEKVASSPRKSEWLITKK